MSGPRIGELFAGYGGLGMGVQAVYGGEVVWVSEFDKGPSKILAHRFPGVPNHGDITKIDWATVEPVDILTGGSPCQDLSHAGRRAGMTEGTRSNLWVAMREAIAQLRPDRVIWENVRGAASAEADSAVEPCAGCVGDGSGVHLRALGRVVGDLADLGYVGRLHGLRAADIGAPHGRFRYFISAEDAKRQGRGAAWDAAPGQEVGGWASAIAGRPSGVATDGPLTLLPTPAVNDMGASYTPETWDAWTADMQAKHGNGNGHGKSLAIEAQRLLPTPTAQTFGTQHGNDPTRQTVYSLEAMATKGMLWDSPASTADSQSADPTTSGSASGTRTPSLDGRSSTLLPTPVCGDARNSRQSTAPNPRASNDTLSDVNYKQSWGDYAAAIARWEHILGRPAPEPTQTSSKGNPQLSARFVEWMMGLPAGWVTDVPGITRNEALKALGNGVVPQQAAEALRVMASWVEVAA